MAKLPSHTDHPTFLCSLPCWPGQLQDHQVIPRRNSFCSYWKQSAKPFSGSSTPSPSLVWYQAHCGPLFASAVCAVANLAYKNGFCSFLKNSVVRLFSSFAHYELTLHVYKSLLSTLSWLNFDIIDFRNSPYIVYCIIENSLCQNSDFSR